MASRVSIWLYLFVFYLIAAIAAADSVSEEFVLTLDHSNFTDTVSKHDFIVVEFYAPWCGHCKNLAPEYEKAASVLSSHDPPLALAKIDASDESNKDIASQYEISGFPTLKIFRKGGKSVQEYKGPREADDIVEYLKQQSGPASAEIKSTDDGAYLNTEGKIVIVGVFPKFSGQEFDNFIAVAEKLRSDYEFRHTLDAKHLPLGESSVAGPLVRLFKPFDERFVDFKDFKVDALEKFVADASIPLVTVFNNDPNNHPFVVKFFESPHAKAMLFVNFSNEDADLLKTKYREVAEQYKGEGLAFLVGDLEASQGALQYFGVKEDQVPLVVIQTNDGQKYLKAHLEPDHIAPWVKDYKDGKLSPHRKSEPIPEVNVEPVKVVVADSLQEFVFNSGKNGCCGIGWVSIHQLEPDSLYSSWVHTDQNIFLLEFYAPWCGHCQKLAPILEEVAVSYQSDPDVLIAKFDASANDVPNDTFDVQGYPTLYFRSASGNVLQYDDDRSKEAIVSFIEKNRDKKVAEPESGKDEAPTKESGKVEAPTKESGKVEAPTKESGKDEL